MEVPPQMPHALPSTQIKTHLHLSPFKMLALAMSAHKTLSTVALPRLRGPPAKSALMHLLTLPIHHMPSTQIKTHLHLSPFKMLAFAMSAHKTLSTVALPRLAAHRPEAHKHAPTARTSGPRSYEADRIPTGPQTHKSGHLNGLGVVEIIK
eukprot:CAMPEP_0183599120 /NCGR_PEP_ID=MMETSP0371-20130417/179272_1 /TAXON_ID=268820 /ORGANISM="Peridinium aciculiferum, Strain PAER-2" /LENGTH=150 /DNA_ID=CAMNT_0025811183 /DNA_START=213 /DNA_END=666 /DNA_ORIENTATION=+